MPVYEQLPINSAAYAATFTKGDLPLPPAKKITVGAFPSSFAPVPCPSLVQSPAWMLVSSAYIQARRDNLLICTLRPAGQLGIDLGDAHIIRNAGGSASVSRPMTSPPL